MLNKPALVDLMEKVDSKYTLVIVSAKRARKVIDKNPDMLISCSINPVTMALEEVLNGHLHWTNHADIDSNQMVPHEQEDALGND